MANYTTTSGFSDLVGSMVVTNGNVESYTSNTRGAGTIAPPGAPVLRFTVHFGPGRAYNINSSANGSNGFNGTANNDGPALAEESWSATASTAATVEASTADYTDASAADAAAKKATS